MIPTQDTQMVAEGLKLLTGMFAEATNVQGILKSLLGPMQDLEDMIAATIPARILANAVGDAIDKIGAIVGEPRLGRTDADYKVAIAIRIVVNNSQGKVEDLLNIATLAFGPTGFSYDDGVEPASWQLTALDTPGWPLLAADFQAAKAAGTRGLLLMSAWPTNEDFVPSSSYGAVANATAVGSGYGTVAGAGLVTFAFEV